MYYYCLFILILIINKGTNNRKNRIVGNSDRDITLILHSSGLGSASSARLRDISASSEGGGPATCPAGFRVLRLRFNLGFRRSHSGNPGEACGSRSVE